MARKVSCVNSAKLATVLTVQGYKLRYKLYTNVSDFTGNRTVPSMDNSNAACPLPYDSTTVIVPYTVVKYEYSYRKVLIQYSSTVGTTVLNLLRYLLSTTYYCTYYLLPATCYLLPAAY